MKKSTILIAEDQAIVAAGLCGMLESRYEVLGIVEDGHALCDRAVAERPDVILTDLSMPELDGLAATRRLRKRLPATPVIVLTMHDDAERARAAFEAGARGYLLKTSGPAELFDAIEDVLAGRCYVTPSMAGRVMSTLVAREPAEAASALTGREVDVARLVAEGLDNSEIARRLYIAEVTVRTHLSNLQRKIGLKNRVEVARYALNSGLTTLEGDPLPA